MQIKWLWILCGIYAISWGDCTQSGNDITCDNVTSGEVKFEVKQNSSVLRGSSALSISGGTLTLIFAQNIQNLYMLNSLSIDGGSASINYGGEHFGVFELLDSAQVALKNGTFQSNIVKNSTKESIDGITIGGGEFIAKNLENAGMLKLSGGMLKTDTLENKGRADFSTGRSEIANLTNHKTLSLSNNNKSSI